MNHFFNELNELRKNDQQEDKNERVIELAIKYNIPFQSGEVDLKKIEDDLIELVVELNIWCFNKMIA
jgi:hypothetical protein